MKARDSCLLEDIQRWRTLVVDLFVSERISKVPQYFSTDLSEGRALGGDALKAGWSVGPRCAFTHPNLVQIVLGKLVNGEGN